MGLHVWRVVLAGDGVIFTASDEDPTEVHLWRMAGAPSLLNDSPSSPACTTASPAEASWLSSPQGWMRPRKPRPSGETVRPWPPSGRSPRLRTWNLGSAWGGSGRELDAALLLPRHSSSAPPLPVLLDPYGGPHFQRVLKAQDAFLQSQWLADQGFAVVVADGRGRRAGGPRGKRPSISTWPRPPSKTRWTLHAIAREP